MTIVSVRVFQCDSNRPFARVAGNKRIVVPANARRRGAHGVR